MIHIAVRVRELVSSNVDTMVGKAGNPRKMLKLLLTEIEESLIGLHGDLTKTRREHERLVAHGDKLAEEAEAWTAKAKTAVDHKRDDLAKSALLAREGGRKAASKAREEAETLASDVEEIEAAVKELEAKREDVLARIKALPANDCGSGASHTSAGDSKTARRMDRIDTIERRVNFGTEDAGKASDATPADVDAEIAALQRDSDIAAELAAMKAPTPKKAARKKAK